MLILASQSPRRKDLLEQIGVKFKIILSNYVEDNNLFKAPNSLAIAHATGKALEVAERLRHNNDYFYEDNDIVLGVDTIVYLDGKILGKPKNIIEAKKMITSLSGKTHHVMSGITLIRVKDLKKITAIVSTKVKFKELTLQQIKNHVNSHEWEDKSGGYAIQGGASQFVEKIEGSLNNIIGLPTEKFLKMYKTFFND